MSQSMYVKNAPGGSTPPAAKLTYPDILCDPLIRLVMAADGVDPRELKHQLHAVAAARGITPPASTAGCGCAA